MHIRSRKTKDGVERFRVQITVRGKAVSKTFDDYDTAHHWGRGEERRMRYSRPILEKERWMVEDVIAEYEKKILPMMTKGTQANYTHILRWLNDRWKDRDVTHIRTRDFSELREQLIEKGYKSSYIEKYFSCFSSLWDFAIKELELVDVCYPKNVKMPKREHPKDKSLKKDELDFVLKYATSPSESISDARFKTYMIISIFTGLRKGELEKISWEMINEADHTIYFNTTKNGREHTVYLPQIAYTMLLALREENQLKPKEFVFQNYYYRLKVFSRKNKLSHIHPHRFRHTATTLISEADISHIEQAKLIGHQNVQNTMRYTSQSIERKTELMNRVEEHVVNRHHIT